MRHPFRGPVISLIILAGVLATMAAATQKAGDPEPDFKALHAIRRVGRLPDGAQKLFLDAGTRPAT